jgi:hypothetical protein
METGSKSKKRNLSIPSEARTIETRLKEYTSIPQTIISPYKARIYKYIYLAVLLYYQKKYIKRVEIVLEVIYINCKLQTAEFNSPLEYFNFFGLNFLSIDDITDTIATNTGNWMDNAVNKCKDIITTTDKDTIIFPLFFTRHANVILFRKKFYSLEWYEPQGNNYYHTVPIILLITTFLNTLKNKLEHFYQNTIQTYFTNQTEIICAKNSVGPQLFQVLYKQKNQITEDGKCILWSLLFIEQAIKAPNVTSKSFMNRFHKSFFGCKTEKSTFFHQISVGFSNRINNILEKNYQTNVDKLTIFLPLFDRLQKYKNQLEFLLEEKYLNEKNKPFFDFLKLLIQKKNNINGLKLAFKHSNEILIINSSDSLSDVNEEEKDSSSNNEVSSSSSTLPAKKSKADTTKTVTKIGVKRRNKQTKETRKKKNYHK